MAKKILIVDDEQCFRDALKTVLRFSGYQVSTAQDALEAIRICNESTPDLILLDLVMPGLSGTDACRELKSLESLRHVPIVILTALCDDETIHESFRAGAVDFMIKPINWEILKQRIAYIIDYNMLMFALEEKQEELSVLQRDAGIGALKVNIEKKTIYYSAACAELLELCGDSLELGLGDFLERVHPDDQMHVEYSITHAIENKRSYMVEFRYLTHSGTERIFSQYGEPVHDGNGNGDLLLVGTLKDVTKTRLAQDELEYQRFNDTLTGISNRRFFEMQVRHILYHPPESSLFAVVFIGLDHFSKVNDHIGHSGGDFVLQTIANRLVEYESQGCVASRFGGDVFSILVTNLNHIDECNLVVESILRDIRKKINFAGHEVYLTASAGVSVFPLESDNAVQLMNGAEAAMIGSRDDGGDRYTYRTMDMNIDARRRMLIQKELRSAINEGQFHTFYQPLVDARTMKIVSAEALVRWNHPEKGIVSPDYFMDIAEESGLILPIGEYVLWQACRDAKRWHNLGYGLRVGVNISAKQFEEDDICDLIAHILEETELPAEFVEVEITESMAVKDYDETVRKLRRLRGMGIKISMDDFGTGYSSLSQLNLLPLDALKVDQTFVRDICANPKEGSSTEFANGEIALAVIAMAHSMGLSVIAEGVETEDQRDFLSRQGSDLLQGFLFSEPVNTDAFEAMLFQMKANNLEMRIV